MRYAETQEALRQAIADFKDQRYCKVGAPSMPSLRDIRRRIASVKNTQQITSAMKMVSAAKLQRAQERVVAARPYSEHLHQLIAQLDTRVQPGAHPS